MAYTAEQQARIDAANNRLATARSNFNAANTAAQNAHNSLSNCVDGKGSGRPLEGAKKPVFGNPGNVADCKAPSAIASCKTDCCSKNTCEDRVRDYNTKVGVYNTAQSELSSAETNLFQVLEAIKQENQNDPDIIAELNEQQAQIAQEGMTNRTKIIWISIVVIVVAVLGFLVIRRIGRG